MYFAGAAMCSILLLRSYTLSSWSEEKMKELITIVLVWCVTMFQPMMLVAQQSRTQTEKKLNSDPDAAQIISSDIDVFWKAYDVAKPENSLYVFRDQYLRKGSKGLQE